ncbi:MAG: hypothetical protein HY318_02680 [Armatimonadetes bacterium]|nr:hypothetical protein [Armatimonadota bacterium]
MKLYLAAKPSSRLQGPARAVVGVATRGVIDELKVYDCERTAQMIERNSAGRDY